MQMVRYASRVNQNGWVELYFIALYPIQTFQSSFTVVNRHLQINETNSNSAVKSVLSLISLVLVQFSSITIKFSNMK